MSGWFFDVVLVGFFLSSGEKTVSAFRGAGAFVGSGSGSDKKSGLPKQAALLGVV